MNISYRAWMPRATRSQRCSWLEEMQKMNFLWVNMLTSPIAKWSSHANQMRSSWAPLSLALLQVIPSSPSSSFSCFFLSFFFFVHCGRHYPRRTGCSWHRRFIVLFPLLLCIFFSLFLPFFFSFVFLFTLFNNYCRRCISHYSRSYEQDVLCRCETFSLSPLSPLSLSSLSPLSLPSLSLPYLSLPSLSSLSLSPLPLPSPLSPLPPLSPASTVFIYLPGKIVEPTKEELVQKYHHAKHQIFLKMYDHGVEYREAMCQF